MGNKDQKTSVYAVSPSPDPGRFIRLVARRIPKGKAKILAGFSKGTKTSTILGTKEAKQTTQAIEAQRNQSVNTPGQTYMDCVEVAQEIRDNTHVKPNIRLQANRQVVDMNGYEAPKEIHSKSESISLDMHTDDTDFLMKIVGMV